MEWRLKLIKEHIIPATVDAPGLVILGAGIQYAAGVSFNPAIETEDRLTIILPKKNSSR